MKWKPAGFANFDSQESCVFMQQHAGGLPGLGAESFTTCRKGIHFTYKFLIENSVFEGKFGTSVTKVWFRV